MECNIVPGPALLIIRYNKEVMYVEQLFGKKNQSWCGISRGRYVCFDRVINLVLHSQIIEHE